MKDRFTDRLCSDCVHCDVVHSWCRVRNAKTAPFVKHPKDRVCGDYYDMFTAGEDGWYYERYRKEDDKGTEELV